MVLFLLIAFYLPMGVFMKRFILPFDGLIVMLPGLVFTHAVFPKVEERNAPISFVLECKL